MRKALIIGVVLVFGMALFMGAAPTTVQAKTTFITIGTGGITGVYYPTGGAIAKIVNKISYRRCHCQNRKQKTQTVWNSLYC